MRKKRRKRKNPTQQKPPHTPISTLCWCCTNATNNGCSWSAKGIPVEGWEATPTIIKEGYNPTLRLTSDGKVVRDNIERTQHSFKVHSCPKFIQDIEPHLLGVPREKLNKKEYIK